MRSASHYVPAHQLAHVLDGRRVATATVQVLNPARIEHVAVQCAAELSSAEQERLNLDRAVLGVIYIFTQMHDP